MSAAQLLPGIADNKLISNSPRELTQHWTMEQEMYLTILKDAVITPTSQTQAREIEPLPGGAVDVIP